MIPKLYIQVYRVSRGGACEVMVTELSLKNWHAAHEGEVFKYKQVMIIIFSKKKEYGFE